MYNLPPKRPMSPFVFGFLLTSGIALGLPLVAFMAAKGDFLLTTRGFGGLAVLFIQVIALMGALMFPWVWGRDIPKARRMEFVTGWVLGVLVSILLVLSFLFLGTSQ